MSTNPYLLASSFSFGFVSNSFSSRPSVSLYRLLTAASIAEPACRWEYLIDHNIYLWCTMLALDTFFLGTPFCLGAHGRLRALLAELFPPQPTTAMMGAVCNCARGVQFLSPVVVEYALEVNGLEGALSVPLMLACLTGTWVRVLPETKDMTLSSL
ncbi:hypothetical protein VYU27_007883 [Nannochloropsis oceanica]